MTATGPVCRDQTLVRWLVRQTGRTWIAESVIPGAFGTLLAQLARAGSVADIWFTGPYETPVAAPVTPGATLAAPPPAKLAGQLADELQAAGWSPTLGP